MTRTSNPTGAPIEPKAPVYAWVSEVTPAPIALRIQDVSGTGLLLSFEGLPPEVDRRWFSVGAGVGLALPVMTANGLASVAARAQIKGVFPTGLAVKLLRPDERLLAAVRHLVVYGAAQPVAAQPSPGQAAPGPVAAPGAASPRVPAVQPAPAPAPTAAPAGRPRAQTAVREAAAAGCLEVLQRHTGTLIATYLHRVATVLSLAAQSAQPGVKRTLEALRAALLEANIPIGNRIGQNLRQALEVRMALAAAGSSLPEIQLPAELTLVATRELRDSIAWADRVVRIQTQLRSKSYEVERRFADLLKHEVDADADPVGVPYLCCALRDAVIAEVPAAENYQRYLAEALEGEVADRLGVFYDDLNEALKQQGAQAKPGGVRSRS